MNNLNKKLNLQTDLEQIQETMMALLTFYKTSKSQSMLEYAKAFGRRSAEIKQELQGMK